MHQIIHKILRHKSDAVNFDCYEKSIPVTHFDSIKDMRRTRIIDFEGLRKLTFLGEFQLLYASYHDWQLSKMKKKCRIEV